MKDVTIYTTRVCPFCVRAKKLLKKKGVNYKELRVDQNPELVEEAIEKTLIGGYRTADI